MISSDDLNLLVYLYLQESGYVHSAFTFSYESLVLKSSQLAVQVNQAPSGALVTLIHKGLLYIQVEQEVLSSHSLDHQKCEFGNNFSKRHFKQEDAGSLSSFWESITRGQNLRYSRWSIKYDKSRDDETDEEHSTHLEHDAKRKKIASAINENPARQPAATTDVIQSCPFTTAYKRDAERRETLGRDIEKSYTVHSVSPLLVKQSDLPAAGPASVCKCSRLASQRV